MRIDRDAVLEVARLAGAVLTGAWILHVAEFSKPWFGLTMFLFGLGYGLSVKLKGR